MAQNPIIDELHRIRAAHAKRFNYDLHAIVADLQRRQAGRENLSKLPLVTPRPACRRWRSRSMGARLRRCGGCGSPTSIAFPSPTARRCLTPRRYSTAWR